MNTFWRLFFPFLTFLVGVTCVMATGAGMIYIWGWGTQRGIAPSLITWCGLTFPAVASHVGVAIYKRYTGSPYRANPIIMPAQGPINAPAAPVVPPEPQA